MASPLDASDESLSRLAGTRDAYARKLLVDDPTDPGWVELAEMSLREFALDPSAPRVLAHRLRRKLHAALRERNRGVTGRIVAIESSPSNDAGRALRVGPARRPARRSQPAWARPLVWYDAEGIALWYGADVLAVERGWSAVDSTPEHGWRLSNRDRARMLEEANVRSAADIDTVLAHLQERDVRLSHILRVGDPCSRCGARLRMQHGDGAEFLRCASCRTLWRVAEAASR